MSALDIVAWLVVAVCVCTFVWSQRNYLAASKKLSAWVDETRARHEAENEELLVMRCNIWREIGDDEHQVYCRRCLGQRERGQA